MLQSIATQVDTLLKMRAELSQLEERLTWLSRSDLDTVDLETLERLRQLFEEKSLAFIEARGSFFRSGFALRQF